MTKLKCKKCRLFFTDNDNTIVCKKCGGPLKKIRVHIVKPENLTVDPSTPMTKEKK